MLPQYGNVGIVHLVVFSFVGALMSLVINLRFKLAIHSL